MKCLHFGNAPNCTGIPKKSRHIITAIFPPVKDRTGALIRKPKFKKAYPAGNGLLQSGSFVFGMPLTD